MYIDGVILFSLLMIVLILVMMAYVGVYSYWHIKMDSKQHEENGKSCSDCECDNIKLVKQAM